ncbi:hypothetical protein P4H71_02225 [Paenibacillus kribbensis]|uniref:hypothetical protein n=1 Tax=Paenibacillus TaxID=44249 RepID=UPI00024F0109|nr:MULTISPECIES: hypothetical protein [Paenibacillus]EHS58027.1 hypothetical protein WG8_1286 [Paenibacillus sp. Aloe-11]MEC0233174.1 hypothetical protein [Paenibacillus kribbensis]
MRTLKVSNGDPGVFYGENEYFYWAWARFTDLDPGETYRVEFNGVPGKGPVSGSFSEWEIETHRPKIGSATFNVIGSERGVDSVRISGKYEWTRTLPTAFGFIAAKAEFA